MSFCCICGSIFKATMVSHGDVCSKCLADCNAVAPGIPLTSPYTNFHNPLVDQMLEELEARIPGLFEGPCCPGDCSCSCTFVEGCQLLNEGKRKPRGKRLTKKQTYD